MTLSILYVDDDDDIRHIVALSLGLDPNLSVRVAASGREALEIVDTGWLPDVAILDVMMPGMDGLEVLEHLRERDAAETLPVLFMTARGRAADVADYRSRGAAGVIIKPFDPIGLAQEVRDLLRASS
ncbi:response regulator [Sphingomonas sp. BIUV-7]|uniref:Response regulator n=1 Tax=Sphingomonas natans TaxID=3063330 RepID=A0ABT8YBW2_9SPHN|nr:response regulator [Sphingomonas sp. BIUV-7]MDO6415809.1 response regulator [Sphingomonas sp. BIUV-7]